SEVLTSGRMFATLDPTVRILKLPGAGGERRALLSDTVGFLRYLPHGLINAFRATLEEVTRASLLLVVVDASSPERNQQQEQVQRVLAELEVEAAPQLLVWNKADLPEAKPGMPAEAVPVSAKTGAGIPELLKRMAAALPAEPMEEVRRRGRWCIGCMSGARWFPSGTPGKRWSWWRGCRGRCWRGFPLIGWGRSAAG